MEYIDYIKDLMFSKFGSKVQIIKVLNKDQPNNNFLIDF